MVRTPNDWREWSRGTRMPFERSANSTDASRPGKTQIGYRYERDE